MPWSKPTTLTSWSFSRYSQYDRCPLSAKLSYIDKIAQPKNAAMERGNQIHGMAEAYVRGDLKKLPEELALFPKFFKRMKTLYAKNRDQIVVETTWAFKRDWTQTTWDDWKECWLRVKLDIAWLDGNTVRVVDHKTGKFSPQYGLDQYVLQLELYATAALIVYADKGPDLKIIPSLHYLDHEIVWPDPAEEKIYTPKDLPALKKTWDKRTKPMLNDKTFAPKPNSLCGYCWFRASNKAAGGGQCKY